MPTHAEQAAGTVSVTPEPIGHSEANAPRRRPAILVVDDEPAVLAAVARDLRRGFGERYRVLRASSGAEALEVLRELRTRGEQVAMLIADQRMPGMPGTEYLVQARMLVPDAKRVLLTAYADTEAAIAAINEVALDYYLLKPWDPPEEQLFPVVEDLLTTWESGAALESGGVRVIGHRFSKESHDLRDFLVRNRVPARWLDVERDGEARELLRSRRRRRRASAGGAARGRRGARAPDDPRARRAPRRGRARPRRTTTTSSSSAAAPRASPPPCMAPRRACKTVMVEREAPGGQAGQSSRIENYLGFPAGLSGSDLARRATDQARRLGAELLTVQEAVGPARRGRRAPRRAERRRGAQRELRARRLGRLLPPARHPRLPRADRRGRLLRRRHDRGARVRRPAHRRHRRRQLRRAGRGLLQRLRRRA